MPTMTKRKEVIWYEVWTESGLAPPYLLFLWCNQDGTFEVYDPYERKIAYVTDNYDDAHVWLNEDEFTRVDGRMGEGERIEVPDLDVP